MTSKIKLTLTFWNDRAERGLPMPKIIKSTKAHVLVALDDPSIPDMLDDAKYYSDIVSMSGERAYLGLQRSARATAQAITKARKEPQQ